MILRAALAGAVGGLLSLDRFQIGQVMVCRPLVSATIVGWVAGDLSAGLAAGILFELLWLRTPPVGGYVPPDGTLASMATAAVSAMVRANTGLPVTVVVSLGFLLLFPLALLGALWDVHVRTVLGVLAQKAEQTLTHRPDGIIFRYLVAGLAFGFVSAFAILFPVIVGGTIVLTAVALLLPSHVQNAMGSAFYVVPLLAVADLMVRLDEREDVLLFSLGLVAAFGAVLALT
jgi:mannose/fructose/N-acetylgalactosamine-specific phosphotransferase system component IIC